ncbi:MAG TPA: ArsA family ATPase [Gemmatimonadaceae bacterium]|nr:ArsA family ATPase [Gemmatimonadaceae bacterium]
MITATSEGLDGLLDALPMWVLVGGKGGVGKTTCAAALASRGAQRGERTLLLSSDPAGSLGAMLGQPLDAGVPTAVQARHGLDALQLDAPRARAAFLARWRETLITIVDRGTYLDRDDVAGLIDAAMPGSDETMALLTLIDLERTGRWRRIILDTAPSGHTLRLLEMPRTFDGVLALLDAMQDKHRFIVRALTHRYRADDADRMLDTLRGQLSALRGVLQDAARLAVVLIARVESLVMAETARYAESLHSRGLSIGAVVMNAARAPRSAPEAELLTALGQIAPGAACFHVPSLAPPPIGLEAIDRWGSALRPGVPCRTATRTRRAAPTAEAGSAVIPVRPLTIVGGKGGVGKTTVACALGVCLASADRRVLVISTDPAPSVGDALGQLVGDAATPVPDTSGLFARQLDAPAGFERFRASYRERIDGLFAEMLGGSAASSQDRAIMRELLSLAPPGIDELYALASLGETLENSDFDTVIVDPAPTGHLLRLLESPKLGLAWSHRLLRLMLKYREVVRPGAVAGELLAFSRRTRALDAMLHDPQRAMLLVVALDEPLVREETTRLVASVRALGISVGGIVWNRVTHRPSTLPSGAPPSQFAAASIEPPPHGAEGLRRWSMRWTSLASTEHE